MRRKITIMVIICIILSLSSNYAIAEREYEVWDEQIITDVQKAWNIYFSQPIRYKSINSEDVYILSSKNRVLPSRISFSKDYKKMTVTPTVEYDYGETYYLYVKSSVRSETWNKLSYSIVLPFKLQTAKSLNKNKPTPTKKSGTSTNKPVKKSQLIVSVVNGDYFGTVTVKSPDSVVNVTVDGHKATYIGNNTYEIRLASLNSGKTISIKAYNASRKEIDQLRYTVN